MITTTEHDFGGDVTHFSSHPKAWWFKLFRQWNIKDWEIIHAGEQEIFEEADRRR